jgi:pimeloyl-ACP methyl ester carboxylesterase
MSTPPAIGRLQARGASLTYQAIGYQTIGATGPSTMPFIFQHGMGGDANQPLGYIGNAPPTSVISLNARGHSPSTDINVAAASFEVFADEVIALADHLGLVRFIIGGISLGAGTALNLAVRYPDRVTALVLCRRPGSTGPRRSSSPEFGHPAHLPRFQPDELDRHLAGRRHPHACHRAPRRPLPPVRDRPSPHRHDPRRHPAHRPQQRRRRWTLRRRHPNRTPQLPPPTVSTM